MGDIERTLKNVMSKGKVSLGMKQTKIALQKQDTKLVILAKNCPNIQDITTLANEKNVPVYNTELSSVNLGYAVGKNFAVSAFAILDEGDTNVMQLVKKRKSA